MPYPSLRITPVDDFNVPKQKPGLELGIQIEDLLLAAGAIVDGVNGRRRMYVLSQLYAHWRLRSILRQAERATDGVSPDFCALGETEILAARPLDHEGSRARPPRGNPFARIDARRHRQLRKRSRLRV